MRLAKFYIFLDTDKFYEESKNSNKLILQVPSESLTDINKPDCGTGWKGSLLLFESVSSVAHHPAALSTCTSALTVY